MNDFENFSNILNNITILYVEDDMSTQKIISEILKEFCKEVKLASNGLEALNIYKQGSIDLIIADIEMPQMNGIELVENIRKKNITIPIIMISAYSQEKYLLSCLNLGINGYILKPINYKKLKDSLFKVAKTSGSLSFKLCLCI